MPKRVPQSESHIEQVRELMFGPQVREYNQRLDQIELSERVLRNIILGADVQARQRVLCFIAMRQHHHRDVRGRRVALQDLAQLIAGGIG